MSSSQGTSWGNQAVGPAGSLVGSAHQNSADCLLPSRRASPDNGRSKTAGGGRRAAVLGYASVGEGEEGRATTELRRQVEAIASECGRSGLRLLGMVPDHGRVHQRPLERPGLGYALGQIAAGE